MFTGIRYSIARAGDEMLRTSLFLGNTLSPAVTVTVYVACLFECIVCLSMYIVRS